MNGKRTYKIPAGVLDNASISNPFSLLMELTKIKITVMVTFTTALGFILGINAGPLKYVTLMDVQLISLLIFTVIGIFFLASAASVLNHYQERSFDALMDRTKNRPIPSGRIKHSTVLLIFFILLFTGSAILLIKSTVAALIVGLVTLVWYNFVYTPLKRISAFAIIPGALVGALPPLAGWAGVNSDLTDPNIILVVLYFFVWQIPHFWILLILYGQDYEKAGYPTLYKVFNTDQIRRITFIWMVATVVTALFILMSGIVNYYLTDLFLIVISIWMIYSSVRFLRIKAELDRKIIINTFIKINIYTLLIIGILSADKLIKLI